MKQIKTLVLALLSSVALFAQTENDTALIRALNVQLEEKFIFVHGFIDNKDTCLSFTREFDTLGRPAHESFFGKCQGFNESYYYDYIYGDRGLVGMEVSTHEGPLNSSSYVLDDSLQPIKVINFNYRENDSTVTEFQYFYSNKRQPDSSISIEMRQFGDTIFRKTIPRFNADGLPISIITVDERRQVVREMTFEYQGELVASVATAVYGEHSDFMQVFYEYDQHGRVVSTFNSMNRKTEYYYNKNGLLSNILDYNAKNELEAEFIYVYTYR